MITISFHCFPMGTLQTLLFTGIIHSIYRYNYIHDCTVCTMTMLLMVRYIIMVSSFHECL